MINTLRHRMPTIREQESETESTQKILSSRNWDARSPDSKMMDLDNSPGLRTQLSSDSINAKRFSRDMIESERLSEPRHIFGFQNSSGRKKDDNRWSEPQFNSLNPLAKEPTDQTQKLRPFYVQKLLVSTSKPLKPSIPDRLHLPVKNSRPNIKIRSSTLEVDYKNSATANPSNLRNVHNIFGEKGIGSLPKQLQNQEPNYPLKDPQSNLSNPKFDPKKQSLGEYRVLNLSEVKKKLESNQKPQTNVTNAPIKENLKIQQTATFNPYANYPDQSQPQNKHPNKMPSPQIKITEG